MARILRQEGRIYELQSIITADLLTFLSAVTLFDTLCLVPGLF